MDLRAVLACGTDGLGHAVLAQYYRNLFARYLPADGYDGSFRVRAALNFGVQQLATRSRFSPDTERYLQVGGFDALDLPAALIEAMPHTRVTCLQPVEGAAESLMRLRRALPADALPVDIRIAEADLAPASFGFIALFPAAMGAIESWRRFLSPLGTLISIELPEQGMAPLIRLHA